MKVALKLSRRKRGHPRQPFCPKCGQLKTTRRGIVVKRIICGPCEKIYCVLYAEQHREALRARSRQFQREHPEHGKIWRAKNCEKLRVYRKHRWETHREVLRAYNTAYVRARRARKRAEKVGGAA